jgi:hypothetical protein
MRGSAAFRTGVAPGGALAGPWVRDRLWRDARAVPSLDLDFAGNKSLVDRVTGQSLVSFARASSGTYVGSDGLIKTAATNEPRFDHNPTTGESFGLLVEEPRTNLLQRSEEFDNAVWTLVGTASRTANTTVAPDGATTADSVTLPTSSGIFQIVNGSANTTYTFSVWIRCNTTQSVRLIINTNLSDPTTLTVTATSSWQRFSITKTTSAGTLTVTSQVDTGGGNTFFLWGAQLEAGAFPTSYILNVNSPSGVTRAADVASITGAAFSSFYNQAEGTVFAEAMKTNLGSTYFPWICAARVANQQNALGLYVGNALGDNALICRVSSVDQALDTYSSASANRFTNNVSGKICGAYKLDNFAMSTNGQSTRNDTLGQVPSGLNEFLIGSGDGIWNGTIKRLTYWPTRLANTTLQSISQP